jgi:hypothetical protein
MGAFRMKINETDMARVKAMLGGLTGAGTRVTVRATNKTLAGVKTDASSAIREEVTAKKAAVDKTFKTVKATEANPTAWIASTGIPVPLIDYSARQTTKGVSVQVKKSSARKVVPGTFITSMKTGHKGVFWRKWHSGAKGKLNKTESAISRSGWIWSAKLRRWLSIAWLPREYRLPIKERTGPRVPDIMGNEPVMRRILAQADDRLHKNIVHETDYELSKHQ